MRSWDISLDSQFPNLVDLSGKKTSEATEAYNCIAWAFGDDQRKWWPSKLGFWPRKLTGKSCLEEFLALFRTQGWEKTQDQSVEFGFLKIALYANTQQSPDPTHAARQLPNGKWTSKLGDYIDLSHDLNDLNGPAYGWVISIFKKAT